MPRPAPRGARGRDHRTPRPALDAAGARRGRRSKKGRPSGEAELIEHCRSRIASYKKPSEVAFVDQLPRKGWAVDYDELDRRFGGGGYPGTS